MNMNSFKLRVASESEFITAKVLEVLRNPDANLPNFKLVKDTDGISDISLDGFPEIREDYQKTIDSQAFETNCAKQLYKALEPVRKSQPHLLSDPRTWAWISLYPMRDYVLARWCDGVGLFDKPLPAELNVDYFFTKRNDLKGHTRCGARRLYIAAQACQGAEGNMDNLAKFFSDKDLYTGIFERRVSLDAELAVELAIALEESSRKERRYVLRSVQLMLGTISLEYLDRQQKKDLIEVAFSDYKSNLVP